MQYLRSSDDATDSVSQVQDALTPSRTQGFSYDDLARLVSASGPFPAASYSYSSTGSLWVANSNLCLKISDSVGLP